MRKTRFARPATYTHVIHFCQLQFWIDHLSKGERKVREKEILSITLSIITYITSVYCPSVPLLKWIFIITFVYFEQSSSHKIRKDNLLIKPFTNQ